jgi:prevent-host-death family protein
MVMVNIHEAKTNLSKLIEQALAGEEIIIAKAGAPVVTLQPIKQTPKRRIAGLAAGQVWMAPDFDELPEEFLDAFYNGPIFPAEYVGKMSAHKVAEGVPAVLPDTPVTVKSKLRKPTHYTPKRRSKKS